MIPGRNACYQCEPVKVGWSELYLLVVNLGLFTIPPRRWRGNLPPVRVERDVQLERERR